MVDKKTDPLSPWTTPGDNHFKWEQSNLDYPEWLGPHEIVRIIENMNINEEQNPAKLTKTSRAHWEFHHSSKLHNLSSVNIVVSFPYNAERAI